MEATLVAGGADTATATPVAAVDGLFESGLLGAGGSRSSPFTEAGEFANLCTP